MAQIIVCCAQKGGCAKTVTVHNLSYALSRMGKRVLAVDFDAQANLTTCFGFSDPDEIQVNIADLMEAQIKETDPPSKAEFLQHCSGVDLIASGSYLSAVSDSMHLEMGSEGFLSSILEPLRDSYDYIIVDTGPKLDNLSINALVAADQLIIPVNPQFLSTAGLDKLHGTIRKIQRRLNPKVKIAGILLTMCETRTNLCKIICQQIREEYETTIPVFATAIPMTVKVGEAVYYSRTVLDYAPDCSAAVAYRNFAAELDAQMNKITPIHIHKFPCTTNDTRKVVSIG